MNFTMTIPGLKEACVKKVVDSGESVQIFMEMDRKVHHCPSCIQCLKKVAE